MILKRCSFTGCRAYVKSGLCPTHQRQVNRTYGYRHRQGRQAVFEESGWVCHYCGRPVTSGDDVAHLDATRSLSPAQAWSAPRVAAHRACHNKHAPALQG